MGQSRSPTTVSGGEAAAVAVASARSETFLFSYSQAGCQSSADIRRETVIFRVSLSQT